MSDHQQVQNPKSTDSAQKQGNPANKAAIPVQLHPAAIIQCLISKPHFLTPPDVLQLQRTIGNQGVGKFLSEIGRQPAGQARKEGEILQPVQKKANTTGIPDEAKTKMENTFNTDFSNVKIHPNSQKATELGALAYTQGSDVHFAPGQFSPNTARGQQLLGHELAHVEQQRHGRVKPTAQAKGMAVNDDPVLEKEANTKGERISACSACSPADNSTVGQRKANSGVDHADNKSSDNRQINVQLKRGMKLSKSNNIIQYSYQLPAQFATTIDLSPTVTLYDPTGSTKDTLEAGTRMKAHLDHNDNKKGSVVDKILSGELQDLTNPWGKKRRYVQGHLLNRRIGGPGDNLRNLTPLTNSANTTHYARVEKTIKALAKNEDVDYEVKVNYPKPRTSKVPGEEHPIERTFAESLIVSWKSDSDPGVKDKPIENVPLTPAGPEPPSPTGKVMIVFGTSGGLAKQFEWMETDTGEPVGTEKNWLEPFNITKKRFKTTDADVQTKKLGELTIRIPDDDTNWKPTEPEIISINRRPGSKNEGELDIDDFKKRTEKLEKKGMSPIRIGKLDILSGGGLNISGQIIPSIPLIKDAGIDFEAKGGDLTLFKKFSSGDLKVPGPLKVKDSSLTISASTKTGLEIKGQVDFGIEKVGEGFIAGGASSGSGFYLRGEFNFDTKLFDPAYITMEYKDNAFSGEGVLGIKEGKVKGIKSATITASYKGGKLEANGIADLSIPGVKQGAMSLSYSKTEGLAIGGSFQLADNIPGIKSGSVEAQVRQKPGAEGYDVTARGTAVPKIPGIDASIAVSYENGAITIEGNAAYSKGMLKGSVLIGATNRPVDKSGKPAGEPTEKLSAYGGGTVTIKIAPWLQGTIGLTLNPNGEIEVSGSIGLPSSIDLFPEKKIEKNIFKIGLDIPIVGVAVAGQRIGIFANISGGLDASAGFGPGKLQEMGLSITYNPAHEEDTHIKGGAKLSIPAHAGLRLFVRGALGAGIPIVSASAGLEIGGQLGVEGAVSASVQVDWTPKKGLVLDAVGEIYAEPKFKFDITGFVLVEASLVFTTVELYSKKWQLAAFEYGSGLRFGIKFPIHYQEGKPFEISLNDVQFEVPKIEPKELLEGLIKQIA